MQILSSTRYSFVCLCWAQMRSYLFLQSPFNSLKTLIYCWYFSVLCSSPRSCLFLVGYTAAMQILVCEVAASFWVSMLLKPLWYLLTISLCFQEFHISEDFNKMNFVKTYPGKLLTTIYTNIYVKGRYLQCLGNWTPSQINQIPICLNSD